jgi:hypothetical protein
VTAPWSRWLRLLKYNIHLIWILEKHLSKNLCVNGNRGTSRAELYTTFTPECCKHQNVDRRPTRALYERLCWLTPGAPRIAAGLIQVGAKDSRHAVSGQIARGLFGRSASRARASVGGRQPEPMASNLLINASPCTRKIPSTGLRIAGRSRRNRRGRRWPPRAAP